MAGPHVLLLSPGAKTALTRTLAEAISSRGGVLTGWEADPFSPAGAMCHRRTEGGPIETPEAAHALLAWCIREKVRLVVPSRHDDLPTLAAVADLFAAAGVTIAVSSRECIELCLDKIASHAWLTQQEIPVPEQTTVVALAKSALHGTFPLVAKHPRGSGSRQVRICQRAEDLAGLSADWIVQSHAPGREFTVNVYVDRAGRCVCEIPHERITVGDGEVVRGRTAKISALMSLARQIAESLPGAAGPLNIQIFWDATTARATVIEINPRFGGGYPLAHEAGGRFTEWLMAEYIDGASLPRNDSWSDGLLMVRYREAMFFPRA